MKHITILEEGIRIEHQKNWHIFLYVQKMLVETHFDWLHLKINSKTRSIVGKGVLNINGKNYTVVLLFSSMHIVMIEFSLMTSPSNTTMTFTYTMTCPCACTIPL